MPPQRADDAAAGVKLRSLLFVPGDSERKYERAAQGEQADGLILDLEDLVAAENKAGARKLVGGMLADRTSRDWAFFVRPNPLDTALTLSDLEAVVRPGLDGLVIPKAAGRPTSPRSPACSTTSRKPPA